MRAGVAALLCALVAGGLAACSYDWAVPADAGAVEASGADAAEAGKDAAAAQDGSVDVAVDVPGMDAPVVMEAAPLPSCSSTEEMTVQQDRAQALVCTGVTPSPCETMVTDECGCLVYVATTNAAEMSYVAAVKQLQQTCIPQWCTTCGSNPDKGICIITDAGGGALACVE